MKKPSQPASDVNNKFINDDNKQPTTRVNALPNITLKKNRAVFCLFDMKVSGALWSCLALQNFLLEAFFDIVFQVGSIVDAFVQPSENAPRYDEATQVHSLQATDKLIKSATDIEQMWNQFCKFKS